MAEQRSSRAENQLPAEEPRDNADSKLRLVTPEPSFLDDPIEPNDESPTIISKLPARSDPNPGNDPSDLHGRKLAHFELLESIGVGGMAAVLRARDAQLDRIVALKILPPEMARDPENIRRFHQEARAAAKLDHENIARVFYCGEDQGLHFIAFEYVEGDNLRVILERRGSIPYGEAIRYILQIAAGLEHAASRGVVHRDVKPSNIIIAPSGRVAKLVDMGLARSLEPHADNGLTQSGVTLGTFDYISPEQALEPREADCRSDIYSLGCTFYHMLTGQPPVPEGTAAKKLQHHQHVAPVDPRQINPDIPDEVARILSKMMAKNVRDRYQRPIQLVQHLIQVARASGEDFDREQMFVDGNMPVEPRRRPVLVVSLAALALAGLLFVLSLAPQTTKKGNPPPKTGNPAPGVAAAQPISDAPPKPAVATPIVIRNEDDLQRALNLASDNEKTTITLTNDIALTGKLKVAGSAKWRPMIEIVTPPDRQPVRLWLNLDKTPTTALTGLHIDGATVWFKRVKFEILADAAAKRLDVPVAAVAVSGAGVVDFDQCWFAQTNLPLDVPFILSRPQGLVPAASVLVDASAVKPGGDGPKVTLRDCYFPTGQTAVATIGSGKVLARDCAFHSLGALVHLKGGGEPTVALEHCSAYLRNGPAFRIDDDTACRLKVDYSLFSVPANAVRSGDEPDLLRQTDSPEKSKIVYQGQANGYQNLNSLWSGGSRIVTVDDIKVFRQEIGRNNGFDKESQILAKDPPAFLNEGTAKSDDQIVGVFELSPNVKEVQSPKDRYDLHPMLGIRHCVGLTMRRLPPLPESMLVVNEYKPAANEKVVDPDHVGSAAGYYNSLAGALDACRAGDVVTLKPGAATPDFSLRPTDLEFDLTFRGFPGTQPTLALADTRISDAYLFRLLDTRLHLENLNLMLEPVRDGHASLALVAMVGNGSCSIKNCTITLKPRDRTNPKGIPLSVVTLFAAEDQKMMTNEPRPAMTTANITMQDCFLRGDGDCVTLRGSRPINLQVTKSLLALGGSLLHQLSSTTKEIANPEAAIAIKLKDSAFFFADPLLWLQAGKAMPRFQHPLRVEQADHCLFATLSDRPLASFETPDVTEQTLPQLFEWKGQGNAYVHFEKHLLEHAPADDPLRLFHLDDAGWKETFERDGDSQFLPMGLKTMPARPLAAATPDDAVARAEAVDSLAPYLTQLPRFHVPKN